MCPSAPLSRTQTSSAWAPERTPKTRSPSSNSLTAAPTASTSPANSSPRTLPLRSKQPGDEPADEELGAAKPGIGPRDGGCVHLTRTSSSLGTGGSTSSSLRISGGPYLSWTTALMRAPPPPDSPQAMGRCRSPSGRRFPSSGRSRRTSSPRRRPPADSAGR